MGDFPPAALCEAQRDTLVARGKILQSRIIHCVTGRASVAASFGLREPDGLIAPRLRAVRPWRGAGELMFSNLPDLFLRSFRF
jgi:hypothetical protein